MTRVYTGLEVIQGELERHGALSHFDFFVLSDSNQPNQWIQEEVAWLELCKQVGGFGKIFYRKRRHSINKKAGNVADFLRRWGRRYRYMIVLDADSTMQEVLAAYPTAQRALMRLRHARAAHWHSPCGKV